MDSIDPWGGSLGGNSDWFLGNRFLVYSEKEGRKIYYYQHLDNEKAFIDELILSIENITKKYRFIHECKKKQLQNRDTQTKGFPEEKSKWQRHHQVVVEFYKQLLAYIDYHIEKIEFLFPEQFSSQ